MLGTRRTPQPRSKTARLATGTPGLWRPASRRRYSSTNLATITTSAHRIHGCTARLSLSDAQSAAEDLRVASLLSSPASFRRSHILSALPKDPDHMTRTMLWFLLVRTSP